MLNFDEIINKCGLKTSSSEEFIAKVEELEDKYSKEELSGIYNYILSNVNDPIIKINTIRLTDSCKSQETLSILLDILLRRNSDNSEDEIDLRVLCAKAISNYKDTSTVNALLYCLNNKEENYKIRLACADALGRIGDKYAVVSLINVVKDDEEKSVYVKESATFALGLIGDASAIDPLVSIMEAKQGLWDKFTFLKEKIVEALGKLNINNAKVLKVLKTSIMDSSPMVRINTIEALMNSEFEEAPHLIRKALHDEDSEVQRNALIALYNLQGRDILDEVLSLPGYSQNLKDEAQSIIDEYEGE